MDFGFSEEQEMLREMARDFLARECPRSLIRKVAQEEKGYDPALWQKMADLGWLGLSFPEKYGGQGDFFDLAILLEEMGRAYLPGPFFSTVVLGGSTVLIAGSEEQKEELLPEVIRGKRLLTLALTETSARYTPDGIQATAVPNAGGFLINGLKLFVPDAHVADSLVCAARTKDTARTEDGITLLLVDSRSPGVSIKPLEILVGDRQGEVSFENARVSSNGVLGQVNEGWPVVTGVLERATAARCAEIVGGAQQVLDMTASYAKERMAFDRPIGSFQAIQHHLANMLTEIEGARLITYQAAWTLKEGLPASAEVAMAKAWASQVFRRAATAAHQIHGAVGFSADHDLHLYFKRAKAWEISLGDVDYHLSRVAAGFGL